MQFNNHLKNSLINKIMREFCQLLNKYQNKDIYNLYK